MQLVKHLKCINNIFAISYVEGGVEHNITYIRYVFYEYMYHENLSFVLSSRQEQTWDKMHFTNNSYDDIHDLYI